MVVKTPIHTFGRVVIRAIIGRSVLGCIVNINSIVQVATRSFHCHFHRTDVLHYCVMGWFKENFCKVRVRICLYHCSKIIYMFKSCILDNRTTPNLELLMIIFYTSVDRCDFASLHKYTRIKFRSFFIKKTH